MRLAESKRQFVLNEVYSTTAALGVLDRIGGEYISNVFGPLSAAAQGAGDTQLIGNQVVDPLAAIRLSVYINWAQFVNVTSSYPTVRVDAYLIATNDGYGSTTAPRITTTAEDQLLFLKHPNIDLRWMLNSSNVTVIKRRRMIFSSRNVATASQETRVVKLSKRLRGVKTFEQVVTTSGGVTNDLYLKGFNFYWYIVYAANVNAVTSGAQPIRITADRYLYFKDL